MSEPGAKLEGSSILTPREWEVLRWVGKGKTNWEIAQIIGCAEETVKKHVQHILEKTGVENRTAAANWLHENGEAASGP